MSSHIKFREMDLDKAVSKVSQHHSRNSHRRIDLLCVTEVQAKRSFGKTLEVWCQFVAVHRFWCQARRALEERHEALRTNSEWESLWPALGKLIALAAAGRSWRRFRTSWCRARSTSTCRRPRGHLRTSRRYRRRLRSYPTQESAWFRRGRKSNRS